MIGYYIHHLGQGHLAMAQCIAAQLTGKITGLSSLHRPAGWPGEWLMLPRDDAADEAIEADAHGQLHWAPLGDPGLRERMAMIAQWIQRAAPSVMVVDVSVEVAALARLMGVPVITMVLPGSREDPGHRLVYALAERLLMPWPASFSRSLHDGDGLWAGKSCHVGAFSRFDGRAPEPAAAGSGRPSVLVLQGSGGSEVTGPDLRQAAAATPNWSWTILGGATGEWTDDPWPALCRADVVVTHAGMSVLAEIAAARKPAVVVPQARPHGEQMATARALASASLAVVADRWPQAARWPWLLRAALQLGGNRWGAWSPGTGARDATRVIDSVAAHEVGRSGPCTVR